MSKTGYCGKTGKSYDCTLSEHLKTIFFAFQVNFASEN